MSIIRNISRPIFKFVRKFHPTRIVAVGFLIIILLGTILLTLPIASRDGNSISFIDALFTATSATCVTGLIVFDTYTQFTVFGQLVILSLIQIGGLGFMTMATLISLVFRRSISLRERLLIVESVNNYGIEGVVRLTKHILIGTLTFELAGAILLSFKFIPEFGFFEGLYNGIFHSISAFCNAGFDLMGKKVAFGSLTPYVNDFTVNIVVMFLIVIGGLGFIVWEDVYNQNRMIKWRLHTKLVLSITACLIISGFLFFITFEWNNPKTIGNLPTHGKVLASMFQSVTTRTAGFNTIDQAGMTESSKIFSILLMFIGGSPGSTAGGIKTITFGVMILSILAGLKGEEMINIFHRKLTAGTILRAITVFLMAGMIVICGTMILSASENLSLMSVLFEEVSAFATVGLTTGITPGISTIGKIVLIFTMYTGRVGVTTVVLSLVIKRISRERKFEYPEDRVMIG